MNDNEQTSNEGSSGSRRKRSSERLQYGREALRSHKDRPDLRPSPHFHDGPSWAHVPGGRKRHEVSFRGSSRSYHDSGRRGLKPGNVSVRVHSMDGSVGASRFGGTKSMQDGSVLSVVGALLRSLVSVSIPGTRIPVALAGLLALLLAIVVGVGSCTAQSKAEEDAAAQAAASAAASDPNKVSFFAVGDNLPDATIGQWADAQKGSTGDDSYDYTGLYEHIKPYVQAADLSYVDQESVIGGNEIGPVGYPIFNVTDEMAEALESTGFDLVGAASNHTYDHGKDAVTHAASVLNERSFTMVGINESKKDAASFKVVKNKSISFAFLDYTYGLNEGTQSVSDWLINVYGENRLKADVTAARKQADVVIVAMHWGTEKKTTPDDDEKKYAKILANAGADVVIGSHPHVIQPMKWVKGSSDNKTLVCYSLGNFLSNHDNSNALPQLEGALSCDFVRDASTGKVSIENVTFVPLVNHRVLSDDPAKCEFGVYALKDYTNDLGRSHSDFGDIEDPVAWLKGEVDKVIGSDFPIDY